jgi:hypothetical protein
VPLAKNSPVVEFSWKPRMQLRGPAITGKQAVNESGAEVAAAVRQRILWEVPFVREGDCTRKVKTPSVVETGRNGEPSGELM